MQKQSDTLQDLIRNLQHENEQRRETDAELRKILVQVQAQAVTPPAVVSAKRESLHENELAERLLRSDTVNEDLTKRLAACEAEKNVLAQQVRTLLCEKTSETDRLLKDPRSARTIINPSSRSRYMAAGKSCQDVRPGQFCRSQA